MYFFGYDHVDARVRSLACVRAFYDRLMPALGLTEIVLDGPHIVEYYEPAAVTGARRFFGVHEDPAHAHGGTRIAFALPTRDDVDRIAGIVRAAHARNVEDPREPYYAVFFEDPDGTKLEACFRT